jgi:hypothetical protein
MLEITTNEFSRIPRQNCICCNEPMYVLTIKRMLSGDGVWDITFCCSSCDNETTAAIDPPRVSELCQVEAVAG